MKAGTMTEQYAIPGFSRHSLVREDDGTWTVNGTNGKPMAGSVDRRSAGRRRYFNLKPDSGGQAITQLGRIVLLALAGPPPAGTECCHNDGNPENNTPENLRWDTKQANSLDALRHGTCPGMKITPADVASIRSEYTRRANQGHGHTGGPVYGSQSWLANKYGITQTQVSQIVNGKKWRSLEEG